MHIKHNHIQTLSLFYNGFKTNNILAGVTDFIDTNFSAFENKVAIFKI